MQRTIATVCAWWITVLVGCTGHTQHTIKEDHVGRGEAQGEPCEGSSDGGVTCKLCPVVEGGQVVWRDELPRIVPELTRRLPGDFPAVVLNQCENKDSSSQKVLVVRADGGRIVTSVLPRDCFPIFLNRKEKGLVCSGSEFHGGVSTYRLWLVEPSGEEVVLFEIDENLGWACAVDRSERIVAVEGLSWYQTEISNSVELSVTLEYRGRLTTGHDDPLCVAIRKEVTPDKERELLGPVKSLTFEVPCDAETCRPLLSTSVSRAIESARP